MYIPYDLGVLLTRNPKNSCMCVQRYVNECYGNIALPGKEEERHSRLLPLKTMCPKQRFGEEF